MKLTDKQAMVLFDITKWSMAFIGGAAGYSSHTIEVIVNQILAQQSDVLVELDKS